VLRRLASLLIVALLVTFAAPAEAANAPTIIESFEAGFGRWQPDSDGRAQKWSVTRSTEHAYHGLHSVQIFMDGRHDDGTTWLEAGITAQPYSTVTVTLSFQLWSDQRAVAGNWGVVAAVGSRNPETESDFTRVGYTEQRAGWQPYGGSWKVTTGGNGIIWVAVGTTVFWEVDKRHLVDYLRVDVAPTNG
jgi:hypothetical protein